MSAPHRLDRRTFVVDLGRGAIALAILGIAGCAPAALVTARPSGRPATEPATSGDPTSVPSASADTGSPGAASPASGGSLSWSRVNLGFVSAYILVRGGEAAIVDTGVASSADAIEASLAAVGLGWAAVGHVILTHHHGDHAGSAADAMDRAPGAKGYAGAGDIGAITVPRPLLAVGDGDRVFDLEVVTAPGHTAGSICVLDTSTGVLVAGDALRTNGGRPALPDAGFTADVDQALASVAKLGARSFETLLVGHGDPLEGGASAAVAELAAQS